MQNNDLHVEFVTTTISLLNPFMTVSKSMLVEEVLNCLAIPWINSLYALHLDIDYSIGSSLTIPIPGTNSGGQYCVDISTIEDNIAENTEQFELIFTNLPSDYVTAGMHDTACVNIVDDEGMFEIECGYMHN